MILTNGTLVAVADGDKLRLFRNKGHEPRIDLVEMPEPELHLANTGSGGRHRSSTANPDDSRLREDDLAAAVAAYLNREALTDAFEHVVVIADPRTLGELRRHFQAPLRAKLMGELAKDLAKHSAEAIAGTLAAA
ncbi:host cell attachment protein [Mesorhizobium sanjuanii]|uniref:Host cell attachment protein n=1 Tax=Mesorhizobium sanjuanii TaxID=2037900 RepID=A0A2A6FF42_9HYPH|nr:host attachment protein [Mesorhizobium sanjuanii]PDQ20577.1 host cell attachment protein [Mesorhizobium sanjuanii]